MTPNPPSPAPAPLDLEAIEARHERFQYLTVVGQPSDMIQCTRCDVDWPCDAAALLAALRASRSREQRIRTVVESVFGDHYDADLAAGVEALASECDGWQERADTRERALGFWTVAGFIDRLEAALLRGDAADIAQTLERFREANLAAARGEEGE